MISLSVITLIRLHCSYVQGTQDGMESDTCDDLEGWARGQDAAAGHPDADTVERYQDLLGCSRKEAVGKIPNHQVDLEDYLRAANKTKQGQPPIQRKPDTRQHT